MQTIPSASNPPDGNCTTNQNTFTYTPTPDGSSYTISYCLGNPMGSLPIGPHCATPNGIANGSTCALGNFVYLAALHGSLTGDSTQVVSPGQTSSAVTAVPDTGYSFVNWSDGSTTNPRTDANTTGDFSVTANFTINSYTLTYTAGANGSLTGSNPQAVNYGASGSAVTAVADSGYHFVDWSDASTDNPRTDTNISGDLSVTANFAITPWACGDTIAYGGGPYDSNGTTQVTGGYYRTVLIGTQCWLKDNLNIGTRVAGSGNQGDYASGIQKYCYSDSDANCTTDGGLYQWHMAMAFPQTCDNHNGTSPCVVSSPHQGICPTGWHIPSDSGFGTPSDWRTLEQGLATDHSCDTTGIWGCSPAGDKIKQRYNNPYTGNNGCNPDGSDCGLSGFEGLLAGRDAIGSFLNRGNSAFFWSSLPYAGDMFDAWGRSLNLGISGVNRFYNNRPYGLSVRCLQD